MSTFTKFLFGIILFGSDLSNAQTHLPVELVYFKYQLADSAVDLLWGTATEVQCYGFYVERYQLTNWQNIQFVPGHGDSNIPWDYSLKDTDVIYGDTYLYRLKQVDIDGNYKYSDTLTVSVLTDINKAGQNLPADFRLYQNFPNPFNPATTIKYQIPKSGPVTLKIYDNLGNEVATLLNKYQSAGDYSLQYSTESRQLSSGVYFYRLTAGSQVEVKKMILLK